MLDQDMLFLFFPLCFAIAVVLITLIFSIFDLHIFFVVRSSFVIYLV